MLGAKLSKFSIERLLPKNSGIEVRFINVDELPAFKKFNGKTYAYSDKASRTYKAEDLQSFTLSRFMPPELMGYQGLAVVIDPDIFAVKDISSLFDTPLNGNSIAACKKDIGWDTSMMLIDCSKLQKWNMENIIQKLISKEINYVSLSRLLYEPENSILNMPRTWNSLDSLQPDTYMVHMSKRLTQPWKTGLKVDFSENPMAKLFGIIPREPIFRLLGKIPTRYLPHPNKEIEKLFLAIAKEALTMGALTEAEIQYEIDKKDVRPDLLSLVA